MAREVGWTGGLGVGLLTASAVVLLVAWPPPGAGVPALLGTDDVLLAGPVAVVAQLLALAGGVVSVRAFVRRRSSFLVRLVIGVLGAVVPVAVAAAYLVEYVGYGPRTSLIVGPLVLAAVVGVLAEVPN